MKLKEKIYILQQQLDASFLALGATDEYKAYRKKLDLLAKLKQELAFKEARSYRYVYPNEKIYAS